MAESEDRRQPVILIIDDELFLRECYSDFLEDSGYETITAENGRIGLELIESRRPDLILCDMKMPEVGGLEVIQEVAGKYPNIPIILISGARTEKDAIEALDNGAWDYLLKPLYSLQTLLEAVENALKRARFIDFDVEQ